MRTCSKANKIQQKLCMKYSRQQNASQICLLCDLPGSGMVEIGLSGSKIPFWTSSSLLARTDIFRSKAVRENME